MPVFYNHFILADDLLIPRRDAKTQRKSGAFYPSASKRMLTVWLTDKNAMQEATSRRAILFRMAVFSLVN